MLIVSGIVSVDPADRDKMVELLVPLTAATQAEDGCITYGFWENPSEPGIFRVYEEWQDRAAMDTHMATPHMAAFLGGMANLAVTGTELYLHEVTNSSRVM